MSCEVFEEYPSITVRHFLFHLWPVKVPGSWRWHVRQIAKRWSLFNGRRILSLAMDASTDNVEEVVDCFRRQGVVWDSVLIYPNDRRLGEASTFSDKLEMLLQEDVGLNEAVFYAHGKGVRERTHNFAVMTWTQIMYEACLDYWPLVDKILGEHVFAGAFRSLRAYAIPGNWRWHYSGTFYWFRLQPILKRKPLAIERRYIGTEAWPGSKARRDEAGSIFIDNLTHSLYHEPTIRQVIQPMWDQFRWANFHNLTEHFMCSTWSANFARMLPESAVIDKAVLEVGSLNVNGSCRPYLESLGPASYVGVDRQEGPGVDQIVAGRLADRYRSAEFDLIICTEVLEHVEEWRILVVDMWRCLRDGGYLLITTRSPGFPYHAYPEDYWRFSLNTFLQIFGISQVEALVRDPIDPGVGVIARKQNAMIQGLWKHDFELKVTPVER